MLAFTVFREIPLELYPHIFEHLEGKDLIALSLVSSAFQVHVEPFIYANVDLRRGGEDVIKAQVLSWCKTVAMNERKALMVHSLRFPSTLESSSSQLLDSEASRLIKSAFHAIKNLKHLFLLGVGDVKNPPSIHPSVLAGCSFKISSFLGDTRSLGTDSLINFLTTQPTIEYWVPTMPFLQACKSFPQTALPQLRRLVCVLPEKLDLMWGRPIEYL
ncbi:hypothetical protein H0H93_016354, partial [Arthromyces matolae]